MLHHTQADQADLLEAAGLDPEALAALPTEMRREVLEQEARNRRMREAPAAAPADPSRAAEMDNASFVATLPPELRQEVLLSADENLLGTLPPNLVAEAMMLRERNPHQVLRNRKKKAFRRFFCWWEIVNLFMLRFFACLVTHFFFF